MAKPAWVETHPLGLPWLAMACLRRCCCFPAQRSLGEGGRRKAPSLPLAHVSHHHLVATVPSAPNTAVPSALMCRHRQHRFCISGTGSPAPRCSGKALHPELLTLLPWRTLSFQQVWVLQ